MVVAFFVGGDAEARDGAVALALELLAEAGVVVTVLRQKAQFYLNAKM